MEQSPRVGRYRQMLGVGVVSSLLLVGCGGRGAQQPLVYPVIVPIYTPTAYGQAGYPQSGQPYMLPPVAATSAGTIPSTPSYYPSQAPASTAAPTWSGESVPQGAEGGRVVLSRVPAGQGGQQQAEPLPNAAPVSMGVGEGIAPSVPQGLVIQRKSDLPVMSQSQREQLGSELFRYAEGKVEPISRELAQVMLPVLEASACGMAWIPEAADQGSVASHARSPIEQMPNHDRAACLNVRQVDNWRVFPPSRLSFRVLFESHNSGERASRRYEMIRSSQGVWRYQTMNEPF